MSRNTLDYYFCPVCEYPHLCYEGDVCPACKKDSLITNVEAKLVNLTPHVINVCEIVDETPQELFSVAPEKVPARVDVVPKLIGHINCMPLHSNVYGEVTGLPEPQENTIYIVSALVAQRVQHRNDVVIVNGAVRDDKGRIIGCTGFAVV